MNTEQPKRTPQQIIGDDALTQLIFEGYEVMPARRSSDEQAEVVGWAYERLTHLMIAGEDRWIKHLSETEPRPSKNIRNVRRLYASPPAVAAGGVTALLDAYEAQVKLTPLGHENSQRGRSTYNWKMAVIAELRQLAALPTPPSRGEGV